MSILITGGAGYIGSHTAVQLIENGHKVVIFDNFKNSHKEVISRIESITGIRPILVEGDIRDKTLLHKVLVEHACDAVIHFAGLKAVGESSEKPLMYYQNNVSGTLGLLEAMIDANVKKIIFSSSATVYGIPQLLPLNEIHPVSATNPYGRSKLMVEEMLRDLFVSDPSWKITVLRYFNPVGAHESGLIGEDPKGLPNNLMPFVAQVAIGRLKSLKVWGDDYDTPDGTGVRDYIHVEDLASGHICALKKLVEPQCTYINLGTGRGFSVLEVIKTFERISNRRIAYEIGPRRTGDVAINFADPELANKKLDWIANRDLEQICKDTWNWMVKNPSGYQE